MNGENPSSKDDFITKAIVFFSLTIIAFYLLTEHRTHLLAYSSYIIFAVFILMHIFMHSGHGGCGGGHGGHGQGKHNHKDEGQKGDGQSSGGHEDKDQHEQFQEDNKI